MKVQMLPNGNTGRRDDFACPLYWSQLAFEGRMEAADFADQQLRYTLNISGGSDLHLMILLWSCLREGT